MKKSILAVLSLFLSPQFSLAADSPSYLCISEHSGGVIYKNKQWRGTVYEASAKYIFREITAEEKKEWGKIKPYGVLRFGKPFIIFSCDSIKGAYVTCDAYGGEFHFNSENGRFLISSTSAYLHSDELKFPEAGVGDLIEIGRRSRI